TEDKIVISRPTGLNLSGLSISSPGEVGSDGARHAASSSFTVDAQLWGFDREADFALRQADLIRNAAQAPEGERTARRLELARFYLACEFYSEAKGVLDVALVKELPKGEAAPALVLRAIAGILMGHAADALKDLANPVVGDQLDAPLWRARAYADLGRGPEARRGFSNIGASGATLPLELQRLATFPAFRAAVGMGGFPRGRNPAHR